ncbi:MAG: hypothetical protein HQ536_00905, partial [Parcubacteria group bacterium]|nr:hypothetical protein [Parcubacteria group bacterium]
DGKAEIIVGAGEGMKPVVNIFKPNGLVIDSFMAYTESFKGGVNVAVGDLEGDNYPEIITGAGPGGGPHVRIFRYDGMPLSGFFPFSQNFRGGVDVATGDLYGDGKDEIITSSGKGRAPEVKIFDISGTEKIGFYAYEPWFRGGVTISTVDVDTDGKAEILTGPLSGYLSKLRIFNSIGLLTANISTYNSFMRNGITVAGMWR